MAKIDWQHVREEKDAHRDRLAAQPFAEKLRTLERLRERTHAVAGPKVGSAKVVRNGQESANPAIPATATALAVGLFGAAASMAAIIAQAQSANPSAAVVKPKPPADIGR